MTLESGILLFMPATDPIVWVWSPPRTTGKYPSAIAFCVYERRLAADFITFATFFGSKWSTFSSSDEKAFQLTAESLPL